MFCLVSLMPAGVTAGQEAGHGHLAASHLGALQWREIGPAFTSGRIADIAGVADDPDEIFVATATGGAWKTSNRGVTWEPIFEHGGTASLGSVAVAPSNPNVVWLGSGETWNWRSVSWGDGVYKSEDGGKSWAHMGLEETRHVGRILIHPRDPDIVFVAGVGALWGSNEERGVFKTTDGGKSWEKVLYVSPLTGVVDLAMDPRDPDLLYATAFQRERRTWSFLGGGPESGVYRSTDGGDHWERLSGGLPRGDAGKIGVSICASRPDRIFAAVSARPHEAGLYRSDDRGASWQRMNPVSASKVRCDPNDPERVYVLSDGEAVSGDGGRTFTSAYKDSRVHVDQQAMWIDPNDSDHIIIGNDGGLYLTADRGENWRFVGNLPVTQFYTVSVDMQEPFYYVYGGTQDNNTLGGPSGTRYTDGIANEDWYMTVGGDGFHVQIDPEDASVVYTESQYGRLVRFDTKTGERRLIQPAHPEDGKYRWNWSSPIIISAFDHRTIYFAANVLFKSTDRGDSWEVISPDLTRQISHFDLPLQGKVQPLDAFMLHRATSDYGNITSLSESPLKAGLLAVGTDDGLVHITHDDGGSWQEADLPAVVPEMTYVSRVRWSNHDEGTLFATFEAHKDNDFRPYVIKSTDFGASWTDISSDLPKFGPVRVIVEHPRNTQLLFVGTEFSVFVSLTGGTSWLPLGNNLPTVPVHDMVIHPRENDLVLGTHGRGFWVLDDITVLEEMTAEVSSSEVHLADPRTASQLSFFNRGRSSLGHSRFASPNPPDGAIINYWVGLDASATEGEGGEPPAIEIEILDDGGEVVRRLDPPTGASQPGIHRLVWDMRYAPAMLPNLDGGIDTGPRGPWVLPGDYQVRLRRGDLEQVRVLRIEGDPAVDINATDRAAWHDTLVLLHEMIGVSHAVVTTTRQLQGQLAQVRQTMARRPELAQAVGTRLEDIEVKLQAILDEMQGAETDGGATQPGAPPLASQIRQLYSTVGASTALPTTEQAQLTEGSRELLAAQVDAINQVLSVDVGQLQRQLDQAGIPWTPGRLVAPVRREP
ncbi:glycosyl hydrolase [Gemmatimonadota bacterium]